MGAEVGTNSHVAAADFRHQGHAYHFFSSMSRSPGTASGTKINIFRLRRGSGAGAHKNQPAGTVPLPFGKGQQPGLGLNGFVLAGPWASNWFFFF